MANLKKVIKLTQGQYNTLAAGGTVGEYTGLNDDYIYLTPDNKIYATEDYVDSEIDDLASRISNSYVRYDINSQGLTDTQKSNARTNIGAGTYSKPSTGIPAGDLDAATRATLVKASNLTVSATNGVSDGTNTYKYTHPSYSTQTAGLYKIGRDSTGHVTIGDAFTIPTVNNGTLTIQKNGTNVATFTANQSSNVTANITVPTKTSDLTNDSGFLTSSSNISESKIVQDEYNTSGSVNEYDRLMIPSNNANRLAFMRSDYVTIEYTTNGGTTWVDYGASVDTKNNLFAMSGGANIYIGGNVYDASTTLTTNNMGNFKTRVIINNPSDRYCQINKFYCVHSGPHSSVVKIEYCTFNDENTWNVWRNDTAISGWSGPNMMTLSPTRACFGSGTQVKKIRLTFSYVGISSDWTTKLGSVGDFRFFGITAWSGSATRETPYYWNSNADILPYLGNNTQNLGSTSQQWKVVCGVTLYENGTSLSNKYLGKTAKAADADKLDGNDSTYYLNYNNLTNKPTIPVDSNLVHKTGDETINGTKTFSSIYLGSSGTLTTGGSTGLYISGSDNTIYGHNGSNNTFKLYAEQSILTLGSERTDVGENGNNTKYGLSNIIRTVKPIGTTTLTVYTYTYPNDSGTFALTNDVPTNLENGSGENSLQQKGTTAGYNSQITLGTYNNNKSDTLLEVGNGTSSSPSNALEVYADGHVEVGAESAIGADIFTITVTSSGSYPVSHDSYGVTDLPASKFDALYNYINNNGSKTVSESSSFSSTIISVSWTATTRTFDGVTYNAINCNAGGPGYYLYKYSDTEVRMSSAAVSYMTALTVYKAGTDSGVMNILSPNNTMGVVTVGQFVNTLDSRGYTTASEVNNYRYKHTVRVYLADKIQLRCEYIISKTQSSDYASVAPNSQAYLARALYYAGATSQSIAVPATGMVYVNANTTGIITGIYSTGTVGSNIYICYLPIVTSSGSNATIAVNVPSESTVQLTSLGSPTTYGYAKAV